MDEGGDECGPAGREGERGGGGKSKAGRLRESIPQLRAENATNSRRKSSRSAQSRTCGKMSSWRHFLLRPKRESLLRRSGRAREVTRSVSVRCQGRCRCAGRVLPRLRTSGRRCGRAGRPSWPPATPAPPLRGWEQRNARGGWCGDGSFASNQAIEHRTSAQNNLRAASGLPTAWPRMQAWAAM